MPGSPGGSKFDAADCVRRIEEALDGRLDAGEARAAAAGMRAEIERLRGERFDVTEQTTRRLAHAVAAGLTIMRDAEDDEDSWELPDLRTINRSLSALSALASRAEDRQRFKRALVRLSDESGQASPAGIRAYVAAVIAGSSWKTAPLERRAA